MNNTVTKLPVKQDYEGEEFKIRTLSFDPQKFSITNDMIENFYNGYYPPTILIFPSIGFGQLFEHEFTENGEKLVRCRDFQLDEVREYDDPLEYIRQIWFQLRDFFVPEGVIIEEIEVGVVNVDVDDFVQPPITFTLEYLGRDKSDNVIHFEEVKND